MLQTRAHDISAAGKRSSRTRRCVRPRLWTTNPASAPGHIIGSGNYGVVWRQKGGHTVVKVITQRRAEPVAAAFLQQQLAGEWVPKVLGITLNPRHQLCITMPHRGESLHAVIRRDGAIDGHRFARIAGQIWEAARHIWRHGVIHGDWKLDNVLLDRRGRVTIIDFDLAEPVGRRHDEPSPLYAMAIRAPELLARPDSLLRRPKGAHWPLQAEYWAVGMLLWALRSGLDNDFYAGFENGCSESERLEQLLALFARDDDNLVYTAVPRPGCARLAVPTGMERYMPLLRLDWEQRRPPTPAGPDPVLNEEPWRALGIAPPSDVAAHRHIVDSLADVCEQHELSWRLRVMARVLVDAVHERFPRTPTLRLVLAAIRLSQSICRTKRLGLELYGQTAAAVDKVGLLIAEAIEYRLPIGTLAFFSTEEHLQTLFEIIDRAPDRINYYNSTR